MKNIDLRNKFKIEVEKPIDEIITGEDRNSVISKMESLSLDDLDDYGNESWNATNSQINGIYEVQKQFEEESNTEALSQLTKFSNKYTKKLTSKANSFLIAAKLGKFIGRYEGLENKLSELESGVVDHALKLEKMSDSLVENHRVLQNQSDEFSRQISELKVYKEYLTSMDNPDEFRLQAVDRKLSKLETLDGVARTSIAQTKALILQNKQYMYDIKDTVEVIIPVFKMQLVGVLAAKYNTESEKLIQALRKSGNELVVMTSQSIAESTERLLEHSDTQIISDEALIEANKILTDSINNLMEQSKIIRLGKNNSDILGIESKKMDDLNNQLDTTIAEEDIINNVTT